MREMCFWLHYNTVTLININTRQVYGNYFDPVYNYLTIYAVPLFYQVPIVGVAKQINLQRFGNALKPQEKI